MEYEFEVEVRIREPGGFADRLKWGSRETRIEANNLRSAVVESLRQATGDAALDLQVIAEGRQE